MSGTCTGPLILFLRSHAIACQVWPSFVFDLAVRIVLPYPALSVRDFDATGSGALASPHFFSAWQLPFDAARRAQQQHHNYKPTTLQLQLQLRYTTLHPAVVGEVTDQVTTATIVTIPKNITTTTFASTWIRSASVIHNSQALLQVSYF